MTRGRFRAFGGLVRRGKETLDGTGQALRDSFPDPMAASADTDLERLIEQLKDVENTLRGKLDDGHG